MAHAVFTTQVDPGYDDLPESRYHFPKTYLNQVEAAVGSDVVYYEPRRLSSSGGTGGRSAYFATARVLGVRPDLRRPDHYYADIDGYVEFAEPVPFREGANYYEAALQRPDGQTSKGAFGRSVRPLSREEFARIIAAGFATVLDDVPVGGVAERARSTHDRAVRDRAFIRNVRSAYDGTCAMTGLKIVNGGGWTEAQAAHIRPVKDHGPDSVRNAMLLSSTMHALFDRGFLTVDKDWRIVIASQGLPRDLTLLLPKDRRLVQLPARADQRPHESFLAYHREKVFKK